MCTLHSRVISEYISQCTYALRRTGKRKVVKQTINKISLFKMVFCLQLDSPSFHCLPVSLSKNTRDVSNEVAQYLRGT